MKKIILYPTITFALTLLGYRLITAYGKVQQHEFAFRIKFDHCDLVGNERYRNVIALNASHRLSRRFLCSRVVRWLSVTATSTERRQTTETNDLGRIESSLIQLTKINWQRWIQCSHWDTVDDYEFVCRFDVWQYMVIIIIIIIVVYLYVCIDEEDSKIERSCIM